MASNHTAGPWAVANAFMTSSGIAIYGSDAKWNDLAPLCVVKPHPDAARRQSVGEANARLIAAAPAMLEALRERSLIHISEPTRLGRISYADIGLKKKKI